MKQSKRAARLGAANSHRTKESYFKGTTYTRNVFLLTCLPMIFFLVRLEEVEEVLFYVFVAPLALKSRWYLNNFLSAAEL